MKIYLWTDEFPMKLWLNGEEVDVQAEYERITTFGEEVEYERDLILQKHFLKRYLSFTYRKKLVGLNLHKEHYADSIYRLGR